MAEFSAAITAKRRRGRGRPFPRGVSGNPKGRPKGTKNRSTLIGIIEASGDVTPLEFVLNVMNTDADGDRRMDAAKAALPYCHMKITDDVAVRPYVRAHVHVNGGDRDPREQLAELFAKACAQSDGNQS
jgi:hypothetical protein